MSLNSAKSFSSNALHKSGNALRAFNSIGILQSEFETVVFPDGTSIQRERQTKAQAKIQALRIKHRNENLRRKLISLSNEEDSTKRIETSGFTKNNEEKIVKPINVETNQSILSKKLTLQNLTNVLSDTTDSINSEYASNEISAIQKQIMANAEKLPKSNHSLSTNKERDDKSSESKLSNLKKIIFG